MRQVVRLCALAAGAAARISTKASTVQNAIACLDIDWLLYGALELGRQQLLDEAQDVPGHPALDDLTAGDAQEVDAGGDRLAARRRQPEQLAAVHAAAGPSRRHHVALGDQLIDAHADVAEGE